MYKKHKTGDEQNFWISYADLMAGLLFVFILILGAITMRYLFAKEDLNKKQSALQKTSKELSQKDSALKKLKSTIHSLSTTLDKNKEKLSKKETLLNRVNNDIKLKTDEITKLKELLLEYDLNQSKKDQNLSDMVKKLQKDENILILKDKEIEALEAKLLEQSKEHQALVEELNITKVKIKNLTGIRIKVIKTLKKELGKSIQIDPKSGSIRFSSNILFNKGEYRLKEDAKQSLKAKIKKYIQTLLLNDKIRDYIDQIIIEGHTDTDGSYLYNLALSQKRALEVMKFIYESDPKNEKLYKKYLTASGRSYSDLILDENGKENKEASRRIEVKFRIKNEKAIKELEKFLSRQD
jgi:chemotaxis protein MotB